jgi:hypothetical protein
MSNLPASGKFHALPSEAIAHLNRQRAYVAQLVRERLPGAQLSGGRSDLPVLQDVIDAHVLLPDRTWELQSLGVAFGDALVGMIDGLAWCEVSDEYGTDPTLRYRETSFQVNALTMVSKRVEAGKPVDLEKMAASTAATLADFQAE